MKRISVFVVGLALMIAGSASAQTGLPVQLPPVPPLPPLPPVPTVPPVVPQVPEVEVPDPPSLPDVPQVRQAPQVPQVPSAGGPSSPGTGSSGSRPATTAPGQRGESRGGGAAVGGSSGAVRQGTDARSQASTRQAAGGGRSAAPRQAGRDEPRVARRERRLRSTVRRFRGCLDRLAPLERRVLALRVGLGEERIHTRNRVARLLDLSTRRVGRVERSGLRRLRALGRSGACGAAPTAGAGASAPASVAAAPQLWTTLLGDLPLGRVEVKGEQDSSSPEPALVPPPKAVVPQVGAVIARTRNGSGIDLSIPVLALLMIAAVAFAVRSTRRSLGSD